MKIQNRIIYTSLLVIGCVLFAWPNTTGVVCDGQQTARATFIIRPEMEEETEKEDMNLIEPLMNLMPSCNLGIH
ncbi:hypothetical protein [Pseudobacter ginsenosidimutans]|uniref:Uncharacterized protein n=1 Tax=Pseudobacter ginsenosidimutans TaxID=661488 RepID=A0A4Q7N5Y5_9BACT|nr:hypothetical protein [Pseudobacter ginsenosidimutans]QEC44982.1 hypothetical protein FSB84_26085 [Pseudobacter ginsenosidimutans]RZS76476.1 hypothetical protein EV199_2361 [Pseudobacter ginsenosidimutans]